MVLVFILGCLKILYLSSGIKILIFLFQAVRKMLALSDSSKTRPHQPLRLQPPVSPVGSRKGGHERSHSDTPAAVDLSVESSSVTSLSRSNKDSGLSMRESPVSHRRHSTTSTFDVKVKKKVVWTQFYKRQVTNLIIYLLINCENL